jgi:Uma2 family endonuclease
MIRRFTVEQYHQMIHSGILAEGDRVELIRGLVVEMSPQGPKHRVAVTLVQDLLSAAVPRGWNVDIQLPITTRESEPEPDVAVVRGPRRRYLERHPFGGDVALVIEVAEASLDEDRQSKAPIYAAAGIPIYWIVNLVDRQLEVYEEPTAASDDRGEAVYRVRQTLSPDEVVTLVVDGKRISEIQIADLLP